MSRALLNPIPDCHAVLCEIEEEPSERPLPDLVVDFCSTLFLQGCGAANQQDVVDMANSICASW